MVNTRSTVKKNLDQKLLKDGEAENTGQEDPIPGTSKMDKTHNLDVGSVIKSERDRKVSASLQSKRSSASSLEAKRKRLQLEAAEAKARLEMALIDKRLEADLADLQEEYSPSSKSSLSTRRSDVAKWVERSHAELGAQSDTERQQDKGVPCPSAQEFAGTSGPVQQLTEALKELTTSFVTNSQNQNLISRISTPRELPLFSGDPTEWIYFKQAYYESTRVCNFSDQENIWRLRKCLRGAAKDAVTALLISATSPQIVISTLELQFGNPDVIINRIMWEIKKLNPLSHDYHKDIVPFSIKVQNYVAAVRALQRDEYLQGVTVVTTVLSKLPTVLLSKWTDYSYPLITQGVKPRLDILSEFLHEEAVKISTCSATLLNPRTDSYKRKQYESVNVTESQTVLLQSEKNDNNKCRFCRVSRHKLTDCQKFKKSLRKVRWQHVKRFGICYKCLLSHHDRTTCPAAACDVDGCGLSHHRLLHYAPHPQQDNTSSVQVSETETQTETVTHVNVNSCAVLLKVVPINIHGPNGIIKTTALLDDGSTVSLVSNRLAERAGVRGRKECLRVRGAWDNTELVCESQLIDVTLSNTDGMQFTVSARGVDELNLPMQNLSLVNCEKYKHLDKIKNNLCNKQLKPEILLGQDNYHLLLPLETVIGSPNEPCATRTPLGWCLHGRIPMTSYTHSPSHSALFITNDVTNMDSERLLQDIHEEVSRSFSIDSMGVSAKPRENVEDLRAWEHLEKTSVLVDDRWYVGLPWKDENCVMPDSYPNAVSRLKGVEQKMMKSEEYARRYEDRVHHLFDNDYAKELTDLEVTPRTWYLPHFGVDNPNKKKLRLVFDAAAKTKGLSLNDYLLKGPDLLNSLFGIMLRFRQYKIAVTGDIKDMFLRIKIRQEDQNAFRFLFRSDTEPENIKTYVMTSLIFGANCSPFIAQFIKNKNAQRFISSMPAAVRAIHTQHYMDDYIDSVPDEETAMKLVNEVSFIHKQGGFEIRNWTSNSKTILNNLPKETLGETAVKFKIGQQLQGERTLGLIWHPDDDTLRFDVSFKRIPNEVISGEKRPTKREMLRVLMSIFDVYGILSPFTLIGKIILQETWKINIGWDEPIPDTICEKWNKWLTLLKLIRNVKVPRYYAATAGVAGASETERGSTAEPPTQCECEGARAPMTTPPAPSPLCSSRSVPPQQPATTSNGYTHLQLHIFCDASTKGMCAVGYWRWIGNGNVCVAFIASRSRVAPNKPVTVPRLELQSAVLAARLSESILKEHDITCERKVFWCDSTTVLHWIKNDTKNYKQYVANRLGEIDEFTNKTEWRYIPTTMNVADIATRENYDCSLFEKEWIHGPSFLRHDETEWPEDILQPEIKEKDLECVTVVQNIEQHLLVPEPTRFSSWLRLLRSTHMVLKFINKCRKLTFDDTNLEKTEILLLRYSQAESFEEEINKLKRGEYLPKNSRLLTLSPYLDEHGLLRVDGRIDGAAEVLPETKRPVILDGRNYITRLIVRFYHTNAAHGNQEMVVNQLKQKFYIIRVRPTVKNVTSKCMLCKIRKCKPEVPRLGDLPDARLAHHQRPFTFCGVDLFGPMEVTVGRRREKRYGVLFTCLTIRAIHVELVSSLTSDSFIMSLRRMAARRGWPSHLYSDNGTNLRGADAELKKSVLELDEELLRNEAMNHGTKWTFIPPASPHWGGAWERLIRSVKTTLKVVLKERAPRDETLQTLLAEVENMVNSRPLSHVSVEPGSIESLTPNHFLLGSSSNLPQIGYFDNTDLYLRKQWRISQRLADMYWKRWVTEVLPDLIPRRKWPAEQRSLQVGDIVFIVDPDGPRNLWPRGVIQEVFPGKDGRVRSVAVRTKSGVYARSATRVARIPVGNECC